MKQFKLISSIPTAPVKDCRGQMTTKTTRKTQRTSVKQWENRTIIDIRLVDRVGRCTRLVLSCLVIGKPPDGVSRRCGSGCGLLAPMALWMQTFLEHVDWWCVYYFNITIVPVNDGSRKEWVFNDWCLCCYMPIFVLTFWSGSGIRWYQCVGKWYCYVVIDNFVEK